LSGLSRRAFLGTTSALAVAWGLPKAALGSALAAPAAPATDAPTTLVQTILQKNAAQATGADGGYRTLVSAAGEPYLPRLDITGKAPNAARTTARRSMAYVGHMSDIHIQDAQSPARLQPLAGSPLESMIDGAFRPQETMSVHVQAAMLATMNGAQYSPLTGAPMAALLNTGDNADQLSSLELRWYIDCMDGQDVMPNSGLANVYQGPQGWDDAPYAWHPDGGDFNERYDAYGFPKIPGLMDKVVSQAVVSQGSPVPWYTTYGNHDTIMNGVFYVGAAWQSIAVGTKKAASWKSLATDEFEGWAANPTVLTRLENQLRTQFGTDAGSHNVEGDPARKLFHQAGFMQAHFDTTDNPGPVGHGFTQQNLDSGETWWKADVGPRLRLFGLDTCNQVMGADGAVPEDQFNWLEGELGQAVKDNVMCMVMSHHNSLTLENGALPAIGPSQRLVHADEFITMLHRFPNMVAWINGHTHINTIQAHKDPSSAGGFWEVTTASCIDFPQQQQTFELVDNQDGTMSIFATTLDHLSPAVWKQDDFSNTGLASLSRELASNDWTANPLMRRGSEMDRNVELLLPAPFDLSTISTAELEKTDAARKARLIAGKVKS
jgi:metallophosphoesterase (TIGR03767 family)